MPARETTSPGAIPFHLTLLVVRTEFPQREIGRIPFFTQFNPAASLDGVAFDTGQIAVIILFAGVKINAIAGAIGIAVFFYAGDKVDLLGNMIGRFAPDCRCQNVQAVQVIFECRCEAVCDLPCRFTGFAAAFFHLVFAIIAI